MGDDGISTAWDLLQVLMDATAICEKSLETALPPIDDNGLSSILFPFKFTFSIIMKYYSRKYPTAISIYRILLGKLL